MIDAEYLGARTGERFIYRRVSFPKLAESSAYGNVLSGSVEKSYLSTTKETCSFDFRGGDAPDTCDLVRIYYEFDQQTKPLMVGTYVITYAEVNYTTANGSNVVSGSVEGASILSVLSNRIVGYPLTIPQGTNAVDKAVELCEMLELQVDSLQDSTSRSEYKLSTAHAFDAADTMLTVVNWLLDAAGYASAKPSAEGKVMMQPYIAPNYAEPVYTFENDAQSIITNEVTETNNWNGSENVVRVMYEDDAVSISAWAKDVSVGKASLKATAGRETTLYEDVSELTAEDTDGRLTELKEYALQKLVDNSTEILYLEFGIPLVPVDVGQPVRVIKNGNVWNLTLTNYDISLQVGTQSTAKGRRMVDRSAYDVGYTCGGAVLWEAENETADE